MAAYLDYSTFSTGYDSVADITSSVFAVFATPASRLIDLITGWPPDTFVLSSSESHYVDSIGDRFLRLPKPPVTVTQIDRVVTRGTATVSEVLETVDDSTYLARTRRYPHDRHLARVEAYPKSRRWVDGQELYKVTGTFGFVDEGGNTPQEIEDVLRRLIRLMVDAQADPDEWRRGSVMSFTTDNFSYSFGGSGGSGSSSAIRPGTLTGLAEIDGVLAMFRPAPKGGPASRSPLTKRGMDHQRLVTYT